MEPLDLGHGHTLIFFSWKPDRTIHANAIRYKDQPDIPLLGAQIIHTAPTGSECRSGVYFDTPEIRKFFSTEHKPPVLWQVSSWNPLTLSLSLLCHCGDHGFIREGKWVSV